MSACVLWHRASDADEATPRETLESFVLGQIGARKEIRARLDMDENATKQHLAAIRAERETVAVQIEDWMRWMGLLK